MTTGPLDNFFAPNLEMRHYRPAAGDLIVLKSKVSLSQEQMARIQTQWAELWVGVHPVPKMVVLDQDIDIGVLRSDEQGDLEGWASSSAHPPKVAKR